MATVQDPLYGLNISDIARICRVSLKTAKRWKAGQAVPPATALMILARDLGALHPDWSGWTISVRGELCSPENWVCSRGDVLSIQFLQAQLTAWRTEALTLREQIEGQLEDQPAPDQWEFAAG